MKLIVLFIFLMSCARTTLVGDFKQLSEKEQSDRVMMTGSWLGEAPTENGKIYRWLIHRKIDGTYHKYMQFIENSQSGPILQEKGFWGVNSGIYFVMAREFDQNEKFIPFDITYAVYNSAYKIKELTPKQTRIVGLENNEELTARKVPDDTKL